MSATLLQGDCIEIMKSLPDRSIDCFLCDLPYGQLTGGGGKEKAKRRENNTNDVIAGCSWDIKLDLNEFWVQVKRLCKNDNTPVLMFCNTKFGIELINSNPSWFRYDLVWNKDRGVSFLLANKQPMKSHEMIYVFSKKGSYYKRIDDIGEFLSWKSHNQEGKTRTTPIAGNRNIATPNDGTHRCVKSVITIKKPNTLGHPTEKPEELYEWLLKRYCPENGCILDPTAGSFNCIKVAKKLKLKSIGIEKEKRFFWQAVSSFCRKQNLPAE